MKMNNKMQVTIIAISVGMLITHGSMAQQADDAAKLEQTADKLRAATATSTAARQQGETKPLASSGNNQKASVKKKKVVTKKRDGAVKQADTPKQQAIEVKQESSVETMPKSQAVNVRANVRAEAQELAKTASQAYAQAAAQAQAADNAQPVKAPPFNRTMRPPDTYNLPPAEDGVHDPANEEGIKALHKPGEAFTDLPRRNTGNRVDWVAALNEKKITPRWDRIDAQAEGMVMDMDIVRVPKGSMPNVVFPHKQHTEWLACANCHPAIFVPQKGGNQISMRQILSGEKCGVCHGKVAFPPSECSLCHSQKKILPQEISGVP